MIQRFCLWSKNEFKRVFPAFVYFFVTLQLINYIEKFLLIRAGIAPYSFLYVTIAAGVVAKVLLVLDHLPFVNLFPNRPLIYNVVWKSFIYWAINACVRLWTHVWPFIQFSDHRFESSNFFASMDWRLFAAIQTWYYLLFLLFVVSREFIRVIGHAKVRQIFFGR